jgi:hypothetical protein
MSRTAKSITTIVFLAILVACGLAVLYFGTSMGLGFGAADTQLSAAKKGSPVYAQVGWVRNNSPWPVDITEITVNSAHTAKPVSVFLNTQQDTSDPGKKAPGWASTPVALPYTLVGNELRYFGFSMAPEAGKVASFTSVTIGFRGPLGFSFHKTFSGVNVAASSETLPGGILAPDPTVDNSSLDSYILLLRSALIEDDTSRVAVVMGGGATPAQAAKFTASQKGYKVDYAVAATGIEGDPYSETLVFYATNPAKDGLKPITVSWAGYRWSVTKF